MKKQQGDFDFTRQEEARARRVAKQHGCRVRKSRDRYYHTHSRGGLQLVRINGNTPIVGWDFDCSPEQIIYWAETLDENGFPK